MLTQFIRLVAGGLTSIWEQRMIDLFAMILNISSMIMMYGISNSIKRALATQIRQEELRKSSIISGLIDSEL